MKQYEEYFKYLDWLWHIGVKNDDVLASYIQHKFNLSDAEAKDAINKWNTSIVEVGK